MTSASDPSKLADALRRAGVGDVADDSTTRAAYSSDASLYRVLPRAVVMPRGAEDVAALVHFAREEGVPLTARGAGTSVAGNAVGPGIVVDFSRHLDRILHIDPEARLAVVEPGVVQASLQAAARPFGLRFGPDPSTHTRCTIGGMIGNDACGTRSLGYGRTSDNVRGLELVTGSGELLRTSRGASHSAVGFDAGVTQLRRIVAGDLEVIRTELGRFPRQISGLALHHVLPENGTDVTGMLVGSEGTLGLLTQAEVALVREPPARVLVVLGYPDMVRAAQAVPSLLPLQPLTCEGLDARIVEVVRQRRGPGHIPELPRGAAWLLVETAGSTAEEAGERARRITESAGAVDARVVDAGAAAALWRIRADGAGLSGRAPSGRQAWAGWEDAAVPPAQLAAYLAEFEQLLVEFGLTAMPFGHFGEGCIHVRIDFDLAGASGPAQFRSFLGEAARLVARHGGSLSGEHGDGRARSQLLPAIYSPGVLAAFAAVKRVFDPLDLLNPGVLVDPDPVDAALRVPAARTPPEPLAFGYHEDGGDFVQAVHRCTGVGACRSVARGESTVMCPSYEATQDERHSTRGRARVLQEMLNGELVDGWDSPAVHEALDLCLSCRGCASDCPAGVDMATYKSEVLHQRFRGRLRPRTHYALGWLPRWARLAGRIPSLANLAGRLPGVRALLLFAAGIDQRRSVPRFARRSLRRTLAQRPENPSDGPATVLFVDTFTDHFSPEIGTAAVSTLERAGYRVSLSAPGGCCGLTWISTGQLDAARRILADTVRSLLPAARSGARIVVLEPSCAAALRHDSVELLGGDDARTVAGAVRTLAELLEETPGWTPPDLSGAKAVAQPHCHQHAVFGWEADARILARAGASVTRVGGCCGLAGNFGVERGHYEISVAVAEQHLLPALRSDPEAVVLADGFSCRTQVRDLTSGQPMHLAQLLEQRD